MKLNIKAKIEGKMCLSANQESELLLISMVEGSLISMINKVNAIANTASQKASSRELILASSILQ